MAANDIPREMLQSDGGEEKKAVKLCAFFFLLSLVVLVYCDDDGLLVRQREITLMEQRVEERGSK